MQLFDFQWLARADVRSLSLLFTYSSRRRLFIDQLFFEQTSKEDQRPLPRCAFAAVVEEGIDAEQKRRKRISLLAEVEEPRLPPKCL